MRVMRSTSGRIVALFPSQWRVSTVAGGLAEMLMGATMETMETFGEEARKAANGGTGVAAPLGELPQQGEQLTASARRRQKRLENKRKRLLQEDVEAAEAAAEAPEAEEAVSTGVSSYLLPAGVSTTALQGQKFEGLAQVLEAEHKGRLAAEAALRAAREQIIARVREAALRVAPPPIVVPKPGGYHAVHLPSGVLVLAPGLIDAMAAYNILRVELAGARVATDHVCAAVVNSPHLPTTLPPCLRRVSRLPPISISPHVSHLVCMVPMCLGIPARSDAPPSWVGVRRARVRPPAARSHGHRTHAAPPHWRVPCVRHEMAPGAAGAESRQAPCAGGGCGARRVLVRVRRRSLRRCGVLRLPDAAA